MRSYSVSARGLSAVQVRGANWIMALGSGLEMLGKAEDVQRLACEVLPNGTVIARDITTGTGYIVQQVHADPAEFYDQTPMFAPRSGGGIDEDIELLPADAIELYTEEEPLEVLAAAESVAVASQLALDLARERVQAESGAVILEEKGYLRFLSVAGPHARKLMGVRLPHGTGVAGFAMEKRRTVVLADAHDDPRHCGEVDALTGYTTRQILVVPVLHGDNVYGVLELMNLPEGRRFAEEDVESAVEVADALAQRLERG